MTKPSAMTLEVQHGDVRVTVEKSVDHPENYLWILLDERRFFLGNLTRGMTRGDVKRMAIRWLEERTR